MKSERWKEVERIFLLARDAPTAERRTIVERECAQDPELATEVFRMLEAEGRSAGFLMPPDRTPAHETIAGPPPKQLGDFDLQEQIGRGGMGLVFRAHQRSLGRTVAVKVLPRSLTLTERQIDRFHREAKAVAKLAHPGIVSILTVGEESGTHYFAMELIDGHDLAVELRRLREQRKQTAGEPTTLPSSTSSSYFRAVAKIARDAADALSYAHQHGIVHRDVKPSNLLLDANTQVKLVDFGLARDSAQGTITHSGEFAGTPHYMSPEQARARLHQVDHRTDVYSLGVVLYELLTLERPFEAPTAHEVLKKILENEPSRVRRLNQRVPRDLETICTTAMAKEPRDRYASAAELRDDLQCFLDHQAIHARPPSLVLRAARFARRHRIPLGGTLIALVAVSAGVVYADQRSTQRELSDHLAGAIDACAAGDLTQAPAERLTELADHVRALRVDRHELSAEQQASLEDVERELAAARTTWMGGVLAHVAASRDGSRSENARQASLFDAVGLEQRAANLFPGDDELRALVRDDAFWPTLTVHAVDSLGQPIGAEIFLRPCEPTASGFGERRTLGRAPLESVPVPRGPQRVTVVFDAGGFREIATTPGFDSMDVALSVQRRDDEPQAWDDMVAFPGIRYRLPDNEWMPVFYRGAEVETLAFRIDATEVSNAEYARFLDATGRAAPRFWEGVTDRAEFLRDHGDLPASGMTWSDVLAYCAWAGKRLPTLAEWIQAGSGPEGRPFPYSASFDAPLLGNVTTRLEPTPSDPEVRRKWALDYYLRAAVPVRSQAEACTPEGLFHMHGNVAEWTESLAKIDVGQRADGTLVLSDDPSRRSVCGGPWFAMASSSRAYVFAPMFPSTGPYFAVLYTGFRCARSERP